jgi:membrane-associated HD superfamily phosphohydrolase
MQKQDSGGQGQGKESARVNKNDFRYSGPKPSSRESAVICLADAVEAASRSLEKPTPQRIEELVDEIVTRRTLDGQLEKSDLKMSDVNRIKKAFVFTLTNMMHARMPYPKDEDTDKQQPENQKARSRGSKEANRAPRKEGAAS